mmetsp:Transcript_36526/g.85464  ORF Transcript_36526/g.85464 Transcript_36526/m.85464 type:complete len:238 (-) Transcript_36526:1-714(-)
MGDGVWHVGGNHRLLHRPARLYPPRVELQDRGAADPRHGGGRLLGVRSRLRHGERHGRIPDRGAGNDGMLGVDVCPRPAIARPGVRGLGRSVHPLHHAIHGGRGCGRAGIDRARQHRVPKNREQPDRRLCLLPHRGGGGAGRVNIPALPGGGARPPQCRRGGEDRVGPRGGEHVPGVPRFGHGWHDQPGQARRRQPEGADAAAEGGRRRGRLVQHPQGLARPALHCYLKLTEVPLLF